MVHPYLASPLSPVRDAGPLFKRGQGALKRKYKAGYVEEWRGGERGRGTRSNESRTERTSWVKGQTFRSCPLAPWVQRALYRVLRDFFPSFSLSFPRESNVGIIQVDKQALTCISYGVVSSWNKSLRIEIPSLEFVRDIITTLIVPRTLSFSRDIRLARSRKVNAHPVHRFLHCDDTKSALKCTYRTHKIVLRGEKTSSSTHARVRTRGSTCTARR